ncbi:MAG: formyltetrahydrofolate deformylase [Pseudomonadota bacterium]
MSQPSSEPQEFILTLSCPDVIGIVASVSGFLAERGCNILTSAQYGDPDSGLFFMRVSFAAPSGVSVHQARDGFSEIGDRYGMTWSIDDATIRPRVLIMVSRFGHCLNDLLYRYRIGALKIEIPAIVSNHRDFYRLAASYDIPFHYLPVTKDTKNEQEARLLEIVERDRIELIVLARYMQVLSDTLCERLSGRIINIHHSFLPSFKGARPYHQAHERGVKLIGATAHYVTADLDEGPIIEQDARPVGHSQTPEDFVAIGRDIENVVLARAVAWHAERRVLLNGQRTVVFR